MNEWPRTPGWTSDPERVVRWLAMSAYQERERRALWWRHVNFGVSWSLTSSADKPPRAGFGWDLVGELTYEQAYQAVECGADTLLRSLTWGAKEALEAAGR